MSNFTFHDRHLPEKILLWVGLALIGLIALVSFALALGGRGQQASIAQMRQIIDRTEAAAVSTKGLSEAYFYSGDTPQLAQANLQTDLQALAESHSIQIEVIRADQIEQIDDVVRLNLTVNGVAPEAELGAFLHGISKHEPLVVVNELTLRRARATRRNKERRVAFQTRVYGVLKR